MAIFESKDADNTAKPIDESTVPAGSVAKLVPGMSDWQKYNYVEVDGQRYSFDQLDKTPKGADFSLRQAITPAAKDIYRTPSGGMTNDPFKAVGISLDKETGNITVTAPKEIRERESFKNTFKQSDLEAMSSLYKRNSDTKIPNPFDDGDEDRDITIPELVDKYNNALGEYMKAVTDERSQRYKIKASEQDRNNIADRLTEKDFQIMWSSPYQDDAKGDSLLAIPKSLSPVFKDVKGYDPVTGFITKDAFLDNFWNLEKTNDEKIEEMFKATEDYFKYDDFADTEEYARMAAFNNFINNRAPNTDFWNGARVTAMSVPLAMVSGFSQAAASVGHLAEGVYNALGQFHEGDPMYADSWKKFQEKHDKETGEWMAHIGHLSTGGEAVFGLVELGSEVIENIALGAATGNLASAGATSAVEGVTAGFSAAKAAAQVGVTAGSARTAAETISIGERLAAGAEAAIGTADLAASGNLVKSAIDIKLATQFAGTAADLAAQSMVDAAMTDPITFRSLIEGGLDDEKTAYLLEQAAWNVGGWGVGVGVGKAAKAFAKTAAGKAMNAVGAKVINHIPVWVSDLNNRAHALFLGNDWMENIKNPNKKAARAFNQGITEARRGVAKAKGVSDITDAVNKLRKVQNATDALQRAGFTAVQEYTNKFMHADLAGKEDILNDLAKKIMSAEKTAGIVGKVGKVKGSNTIRVFSKETANYIAAAKQAQVLENIRKVTGGLTKEQEKGLEVLSKMMNDSAEVMGKDIVALADKYIVADQKWWQEFNRIRMDQGLLNKAEIEELKESGLWGKDGELYSRTQRVQEDPTYLHTRADGQTARKNVTLVDEYQWGSGKDFADPMITRYESMMQAGIERDSKRYFEAMKNIPGVKAETVISGAETERVRQFKKFKSTFENQTKRAINNVIPEMFSKNGIMANAAKMDFWDQRKLNAEFEMVDAAVKKSAASTKKIRLTDSVVSNAAMSMPDDAIDEFLSINGISANNVTRENFSEFIDSLSKDSRNMIINRIQEMNTADMERRLRISYNSGEISKKEYKEALAKQYQQPKQFGFDFDTTSDASNVKKPATQKKPKLEKDIQAYGDITDVPTTTNLRTDELTYDNWEAAVKYSSENGDDLVASVNRANIATNKDFLKNEMLRKYAEEQERAKLIAEKETIFKDKVEYFNKFSTEEAKNYGEMVVERVIKNIDEGLDSFIDTIMADANSARVVDALIEESGAIDKKAAKEYLLLYQLKREPVKVKEAYRKEVAQQLRAAAKNENNAFLKGREDDITKKIDEMFEDRLDDRFNNARQSLLDQGGKAADLVDKKHMYKQIYDLDREITGKAGKVDVIAYQNADGAIEYIETSPLVAGLYNFRPGHEDMSKAWKAMNISSKVFRLGTTGLNIKSLVNQMFRDFGNAWLAGGMWHTFKGASNRLVDEFGESLVEAIKRSDPEAYKAITAIAEETGEDLATTAAKQVETRAKILSQSATETDYYRRAIDGRKQVFSAKNGGVLEYTSNKIDAAAEKLGKINEAREKYLRRAVYMNGFYDALQKGQTLDDALETAEFLMNNATTNFSRQLVHLNKLQGTIPYLGAAINGTRSFWRIFSIDPVGVMSRLIGGAIVPMMAITSHNMIDPDNREKYEQLAEYEKDENFIIGVGGEFVKVPIPQEIAPILAPFRQMVEGLNGMDKHNFWELAANDILGFSPVSIDGFYDLDQNDLTHDLTFWDRMGNGFAKLIAQVSPPPIKSVIMATTGKDPYTGKKIDTRYAYYDEESGEVQIMDSSQSAFAKVVSGLFGGSAQLAEKVITNIFGQTGLDVLDIFTSAAQAVVPGGEDGDLLEMPERMLSEAFSPMSVADYDRTNQQWNQAVRELYEEKEKIIDDDKGEYQKISQQINMEKDPEKRSKLIAQRKSLLQPWQKKVGTMIMKFQDRYGEEAFDRFRLASVISLLNTNKQDAGLNAADRADQQGAFYAGRDEARQTLIDMGCKAAGDTSMLGYFYRNKDTGEVEIKYNTPLEILAAQNAFYGAKDIHRANVEQLAQAADLKNKKKSIKAQRDALYDAAKPDYDQINALEVNWNAEVMKTLAPYVERFGAESVINNDEVMDYLEELIYVPSEFKKDSRGKYVTNKKLSRKPTNTSTGADADASKAYIENYIKQIWKVNDTGWYNGKNYSGRKTLGVE